MRLVVAVLAEIRLIGRDKGQTAAVRQRDQLGLDRALVVEAVTLDFHVELVAEGTLQDLQPFPREVLAMPGTQCRIERSSRAAGQGDQALAMGSEPGRCNARRIA